MLNDTIHFGELGAKDTVCIKVGDIHFEVRNWADMTGRDKVEVTVFDMSHGEERKCAILGAIEVNPETKDTDIRGLFTGADAA
jgi:hypothetical protein